MFMVQVVPKKTNCATWKFCKIMIFAKYQKVFGLFHRHAFYRKKQIAFQFHFLGHDLPEFRICSGW